MCLVSVVGTSRCDVRAACSGATPWIASVTRTFIPPATARAGRRSAPSLPPSPRRYIRRTANIPSRICGASGSALGHRVRPDALQTQEWLTVVGVLADMKNENLAQPPRPEIYYPYAQFPTRGLSVMVRTAVPPMTLAQTARREIWNVD